ncbi:16S rRNA (guanine(527)-N(7))-methyltransferase RsmG [Sphingosinicella terrae]|uniref:16S rRNA (guanine(527)-N(7))-methyltransferase RsmG n=1 Tax=Sphingosinicella terrae TaxID=2172047 RepID=UPI000E0D4E5E|nr:16S rRNA (guanine(527)-N(7))-methyltransferase RsmG [Sphingosinicella terrae]
MSEDEARAWIEAHFDVPRETMAALDRFASFLRESNERQNLVSSASLLQLWRRHIVDSAQLLSLAPSHDAGWLDLGAGAGFPGLIVAALHGGPVTLIEERRLRVEFLREAARLMSLDVEVIGGKVERVAARPFGVISARAFAPLPRLLDLGLRFSTGKTVWLLPKGRNAQAELEALGTSWQGDFRLEASVTDQEARIIVATGVRQGIKRKTG